MSTAKLRYLHGLIESALRMSENIDTFERNLESGYYNDKGRAGVAHHLDMLKPELASRVTSIIFHANVLTDFETPRCLVLATGHVTHATMDLLELGTDSLYGGRGWPAMSIGSYPHGVFMTVPPLYLEEEYTNLPPDLRAVCDFARAKGCDLLRLDADGDIVDTLPLYQWS